MGGDTRVRLFFTCGQVGGSPGFLEEMLRQDLTAEAPPVRAGSAQRRFRQSVSFG